VEPDEPRQCGRSARPRPPSSLSATSVVEDRPDIVLAGLSQIARFDFLPRRPCLGPLPLFSRAQLGAIVKFAEVLVEEDSRRGRNLETTLLRVRGESPAVDCGELNAQRANPA